jgi:pre-rRNA-processing protein TSR4
MESSAKKLSSLRITSLDGDDDETEDPHQPPPAGPSAAAADSDDDDEEEEAEVTLGVLSKPKHPGLLLRHLFPSKAGGIPVRAPTRDKFQ